ncbi:MULTISPECIES: chemotaxis protein CheW [unclassified Pseudomonas]|uniref:chemotaxis protein CheW n=1 Tax=unclassified Pseudomonas TaxID=196821 RepID=UPI00244A3AEC|nr:MULTISPECIES: chemotaxis protein CheW [unclassified Pseudomonas]MDG9922915.1 chemotaxis protein CheW [Pseudomonas sp. GD04045]MDH0035721.1 chemotaxis protein CheW [Pseudomonas sp. GD04019]
MNETNSVEERWTQLRERLAEFERRIDQGFSPDPGEQQERLLQRTREWARSVEEARPDSLIELLSFTLGEELYAIETGHVGAVLPLPHFTPLPGTPPFVLGIVNVRGHIVSVLDLRVFFELPIEGLSDKNYLVVLRNQDMEFGLLADRIRGIEQIPRDSLQAGLANLTGIRANYLLGVTAEQTTVLDGARLLGDPNLRIHADD